jgi:hypothetical protein
MEKRPALSSKRTSPKKRTAAAIPSKPNKTKQSGFDLDGWASGTHARTGVGLGNDDFANRLDESLPPRRFTGKEKLPRFGGTAKRGK